MSFRLTLGAAAVAVLASAASAQIRPDGVMLRFPDVSQDEIVFRYDGDLWLVPKTGGVARRLTSVDGNESFAKFSPDGRRVAFLGAYDGGADLYVLDVAAGAPERVTYHPGQELLSDWTPDGSALLFSSSEVSGLRRAAKLLRVSASGGQPEPLPVPYGTFGVIDATGRWLAYTPQSREFRTWKRYRGGMAGDIWLYDLQTGAARNATRNDANDELPMWRGGKLYFRSDRGAGVFNLYEMDPASGETKQLTRFDVADVQFPSIGPDDIVFENGGKLYRLDLTDAARPYAPVDVVIPGERPQLRARAHDVTKLVEVLGGSPAGERIALEARGDVWNVPVKEGVKRNVTHTSGIAERAPAWSPDGEWLAYFSDKTGEYEVTLRRADGKPFDGADPEGERTLTQLGPGWKDSIRWSPDSKTLAVESSLGALDLVDRETGATTHVTDSPDGGPLGASWSADSGWLAWSHQHPEARMPAIFLYDVANARTHLVTSGMFADRAPAFDRSGDFLYFVSSRTFEPTYADLDTTWIYRDTENVCYVPLRADVDDPFLVEDAKVEAPDDAKKDDAKKGEEAEGGDADEQAAAGADAGDGAEKKADDEGDEDDGPMTIDLDGFESRVRMLPLEGGGFGGVVGGDGKVIFVRRGGGGGLGGDFGGGGGQAELGYYDLKEKEAKTVLKGAIRSVSPLADGKHLLVEVGADVGVIEIAPDQKLEPVDLDGLVATTDPRAEWAQILRDAWRLYRDFFYDPGMHGLDWDAVGERYTAALADCTSRSDVQWLIGEMMGELNVGHAYNDQPSDDVEPTPDGRGVGLLGCDWQLDGGAYRIARIYDGGYDADARSPLARNGVDAREGDYLLAVNGIAVDASRAVYAAFEGTEGQPTALTLNAKPMLDGEEREVIVEPLASESDLRYRAWVADNRAKVDELSGGRVGYVHVPDTGINGQNELMRQLLGQQHKDALLVDERWNAGGQIPTRFIELLDRPATNYWALRAGRDWTWPPNGHRGPKAMLINFAAGSGGDCFPYFFRQAGLGKLIGTRTWGGLVGISGNPRLIDGSQPSVPRFAFFELDGTWGVEGHGVDPDVEVIDDPSLYVDGVDPQLRAGVAELLAELEGWTKPEPRRPKGADRKGAGIPPEDY